ncbi:MAG: hypothetical protein DBX47_03455 [Clostridiales bacterium]|nr:MAG: hypothetical protein DBX47_03455 [Clostridiales bacterium]
MMFCPACGRLMTQTDFGYQCFCGAFADKNGNQIDLAEMRLREKNSEKLRKRKKYRFKYENLGDDEDESKRKCKFPYSEEDIKWL